MLSNMLRHTEYAYYFYGIRCVYYFLICYGIRSMPTTFIRCVYYFPDMLRHTEYAYYFHTEYDYYTFNENCYFKRQ